jgi:chemotaxis signal transduction protein
MAEERLGTAGTAPPDALGAASQLLLARIGSFTYAVPTSAVERILRMAALTPLPGAPPGVVGVLNLQGAVLPAVDPRPRLDVPTPVFDAEQHLVVMCAGTRYLLWVDRAERIVSVSPRQLQAVEGDAEQAVAPSLATVEGGVFPILSPQALDPGPIVRAGEAGRDE